GKRWSATLRLRFVRGLRAPVRGLSTKVTGSTDFAQPFVNPEARAGRIPRGWTMSLRRMCKRRNPSRTSPGYGRATLLTAPSAAQGQRRPKFGRSRHDTVKLFFEASPTAF